LIVALRDDVPRPRWRSLNSPARLLREPGARESVLAAGSVVRATVGNPPRPGECCQLEKWRRRPHRARDRTMTAARPRAVRRAAQGNTGRPPARPVVERRLIRVFGFLAQAAGGSSSVMTSWYCPGSEGGSRLASVPVPDHPQWPGRQYRLGRVLPSDQAESRLQVLVQSGRCCGRSRQVVHVLHAMLTGLSPLKGLPGDHLVHDHAERVQIGGASTGCPLPAPATGSARCPGSTRPRSS